MGSSKPKVSEELFNELSLALRARKREREKKKSPVNQRRQQAARLRKRSLRMIHARLVRFNYASANGAADMKINDAHGDTKRPARRSLMAAQLISEMARTPLLARREWRRRSFSPPFRPTGDEAPTSGAAMICIGAR